MGGPSGGRGSPSAHREGIGWNARTARFTLDPASSARTASPPPPSRVPASSRASSPHASLAPRTTSARGPPRLLHHIVSDSAREKGIGPGEIPRRATVHLVVRGDGEVVAATVQRDVEGVPKWTRGVPPIRAGSRPQAAAVRRAGSRTPCSGAGVARTGRCPPSRGARDAERSGPRASQRDIPAPIEIAPRPASGRPHEPRSAPARRRAAAASGGPRGPPCPKAPDARVRPHRDAAPAMQKRRAPARAR